MRVCGGELIENGLIVKELAEDLCNEIWREPKNVWLIFTMKDVREFKKGFQSVRG